MRWRKHQKKGGMAPDLFWTGREKGVCCTMTYEKTEKAFFISRENRFTATVRKNGETFRVHVKNTGRCRELLVPGAEVLLSKADNPARKTEYDLVSVWKQTPSGSILVNIDSQIANDVAGEWLRGSGFVSSEALIRREVTRGDSRFDFYVEDGERRIYIEVKGVTLEENGRCRFPDAPTERGRKHLRGLQECVCDGYEAALLFIVQFKGALSVEANTETDPAFGDALGRAAAAGVRIMAVDCDVTENAIIAADPVPVLL